MEKKLFEAAATVSWHQRTTFASAQSLCKREASSIQFQLCAAKHGIKPCKLYRAKSEDSARTPTERDG